MKLRRVVTVTTSGDRRVGRDGKSYPAHPTQPPQAMPVSPPASPDGGERPDLDNNVIEIAVDRPDEPTVKVKNINVNPDPPPPVTPGPVNRHPPVTVATPAQPRATRPAVPPPTPTPARVSGNTPAQLAQAIRAKATPDFVLELILELTGDDVVKIVQRLVSAKVIAVAVAGESVYSADFPSCVVPLDPDLVFEALQVVFHPHDLRRLADRILTAVGDEGR
jgi:hypothetical protein